MNSGSLVERIREKIDASAEVGSGPWTNRDILGNVNAGLRFLAAHRIGVHPFAYLRVGLLSDLGAVVTSSGAGIFHVSLPDYVVRVLRLERPDTSQKLQVEARLVDTTRSRDRRPGYDEDLLTLDQWVPGFQNGLVYRGASAPTLSDVRVWYVHRPPDLVRFTAASGSTTTVINVTDIREGGEDGAESNEPLGYLSALASHYVGVELEVILADGAAPQGQVRRVSAYSVGTYPAASFTVDTAFSAAVPDGAIIDMRPMMDPLWEELIVYSGAARCLDRVGNWENRDALRVMASELFQSWAKQVANPQGQEQGRITWGWNG